MFPDRKISSLCPTPKEAVISNANLSTSELFQDHGQDDSTRYSEDAEKLGKGEAEIRRGPFDQEGLFRVVSPEEFRKKADD